MTTMEHQAIAKLLAESPRLVPVLLNRTFDYDMPVDVDVVPAPETIRDLRRPDLVVDGTVVVADDQPERREATALEVQRDPDDDKHMSWPVHVAGLRRRLGCPVILVVVTGSVRTARWADRPIDLGRGRMVLHPLVIGPQQIPRILDPREAREHPELAALGVIVHGRKSGSFRLGQVAIEAALALAKHDSLRATLLFDIITAFLGRGVRKRLEKTMDLTMDVPFSEFGKKHYFRGVEQGIEQGIEQGEVSGRARSLLLFLEARGLSVSKRHRRRIQRCKDPSVLDRWIQRAATAMVVDDVLTSTG